MFNATDHWHMQTALGLAARGLGHVWPNPAVGCVIVDANGHVAGRGWTQAGGRPHAETEALNQAGARAKGGAAYVTLEPCAHHGKTPPCAEALVAAGVARVAAAITDPDPRVAGRGIEILRAAGIRAETGLCEAEARDLNAGFFSRIERGRPLVTLKLAASLDGQAALANGESQWITGPRARQAGHRLRAAHDAILTGSGTVLADDPELTCRLPGLENRSPVRVLVDGAGRVPATAKLFQGLTPSPSHGSAAGPSLPPPGGGLGRGGAPVWVFTAQPGHPAQLAGAEVVSLPGADGHVDLAAMLAELARRGVTRVLAEGGGGLAAALLRLKLADRLALFSAPKLLGGDGRPMIGPLHLPGLSAAIALRARAQSFAGDDLLECFDICG